MEDTILCCECMKEIKASDDAYTVVYGYVEDIICKECAARHPDARPLE